MQTNKNIILASALASLMLVTTTASSAEEKKVTDIVIATVNGSDILKSKLDGYLAVLTKQGKGKANKQVALDDIIATEIALQKARKTDILDRPASKKAIADFTTNILLKTWTKEKVLSFEISDEELKSAYEERVTKLAGKEYNARHILVKTEDEAKAIIKDIAGGADFEKLAKEKSTGPSGSNGGSLGWFKAKTMVPAFANAVKAMKKGDVSKEPVKTQFGFHIIKVEDSRDTKLPTLDSMKAQLKRVISQNKMLAYMKDLRKESDVKITLPEEPAEAEKPTEEKKKEN